MNPLTRVRLIVFAVLFGSSGLVFSQQQQPAAQSKPKQQKSVPVVQKDKKDKKKPAQQEVVSEIVLGEIKIEAIIEQPNVDIFQNRVKVDVEEIAFIDRSFEPEIKEIPKNLLLYDEELDSARKLTRLKKVLEERQKKLKK